MSLIKIVFSELQTLIIGRETLPVWAFNVMCKIRQSVYFNISRSQLNSIANGKTDRGTKA